MESAERNMLHEYIHWSCAKGRCTTSDFNNVLPVLYEGELLEVIQAIHKFCVIANKPGNSDVNSRTALLLGVLHTTQNWWKGHEGMISGIPNAGSRMSPNAKAFVVKLCMEGSLSPSMLSPGFCGAILQSSNESLPQALKQYETLHRMYDSFYACQELLINLILQVDPPPTPSGSGKAMTTRSVLFVENVPTSELERIGASMLQNRQQQQPPRTTWADKIGNSSAGAPRLDSDHETSSDSSKQEAGAPIASPSSALSDTPAESISEADASAQLPNLLNAFILSKCASNEHCRKSDFDGTAREALQRISFIQALQAIEHFASSVSSRIQKRPAYLMGILRGQENHWDKSRAAAELPGGSAELLGLSPKVLLQIGRNCLSGNCVPSDFTPEVCLALHRLPPDLALKALEAFNGNKRIMAGCRGGVLNRPRFFERLIQNVANQNGIKAKESDGTNTATVNANPASPGQGGKTNTSSSVKVSETAETSTPNENEQTNSKSNDDELLPPSSPASSTSSASTNASDNHRQNAPSPNLGHNLLQQQQQQQRQPHPLGHHGHTHQQTANEVGGTRGVRRALSLSLSFPDDDHHLQQQQQRNAWNSPLTSSPMLNGNAGAIGWGGPRTQQQRTFSLDAPSYPIDGWNGDGLNGFSTPQNQISRPSSLSISNDGVMLGGGNITPNGTRETRANSTVVGSPVPSLTISSGKLMGRGASLDEGNAHHLFSSASSSGAVNRSTASTPSPIPSPRTRNNSTPVSNEGSNSGGDDKEVLMVEIKRLSIELQNKNQELAQLRNQVRAMEEEFERKLRMIRQDMVMAIANTIDTVLAAKNKMDD